jgi:hypothetical protein
MEYEKGEWEDNPETDEQRERARQLKEGRKSMTLAVTQHQTWQADRHYDGGNYSHSVNQLEEIFIPLYRVVPDEFKASAFKAAYAYRDSQLQDFINYACNAVTHFTNNGCKQLLRYFFEMAENAPDMGSMGRGYLNESFPIADHERALQECRAIDAFVEFKTEAFEFAKFTIRAGKEWYRHYSLSFLADDASAISYERGREIVIPKIIVDFKAAGYSKEKIEEIFAIINRADKLPKRVKVEIIRNYLKLDQVMPGGVSALFEYLDNISPAPGCCIALVEKLCDPKLKINTDALPLYLKLGKKVVEKLGDGGEHYFRRRHHPDSFDELINTDPDEFKRQVGRVIGFAKPIIDIGGAKESTASNKLVEAYAENFDKPNFSGGCLKFLSAIRALYLSKMRRGVRSWKDDSVLRYIMETLKYLGSFRSMAITDPNEMGYEEQEEDPFPKNFDYNFFIKFIAFLLTEDEQMFYGRMLNFDSLISEGLDYRLAAHVESDMAQAGQKRYHVRQLPFAPKKLLIDERKIVEVLELTNLIDQTIAEVTRLDNGYVKLGSDPASKTKQPTVFEKAQQLALKLQDLRRQCQEITSGVQPDSVFNFGRHIKRLENAVEKVVGKSMLSFSRCAQLAGEDTSFDLGLQQVIKTQSESTRMLITAMAFMQSLRAAGVNNVLGAGMSPSRYFEAVGGKDAQGEVDDFGELIAGSKRDQILHSMRQVAPIIERNIIAHRVDIPFLFPEGGKIHTEQPIDDSSLDALNRMFGIESTPFVLQHANKSLCLPPALTAYELKMYIAILEAFGLLDGKDPDLQLTMSGEWSKRLASRIGTAMLLGTQRGVIFEQDAFRSKMHDDATGAHIMAYGAGGIKLNIPTQPICSSERTDIFGRHDVTDADLYQIVGTLGTSLEYDRIFKPVAVDFFERLEDLMDRKGLTPIAESANWIFDHQQPGDLLRHVNMVNEMGERWMRERRLRNFGIISEINKLVAAAVRDMRAVGQIEAEKNPKIIQALESF